MAFGVGVFRLGGMEFSLRDIVVCALVGLVIWDIEDLANLIVGLVLYFFDLVIHVASVMLDSVDLVSPTLDSVYLIMGLVLSTLDLNDLVVVLTTSAKD